MSLKIFRAQSIITCDSAGTIINDGFLAIQKEKIIDVGPWKKRPKKGTIIDASFGVITPGLYNLHTHLAMTLLRGIAEDLDLQKWLFENIIPLESQCVNPEFVKLGTELGLLESIRFGVIGVSDMYYFEEEVAKAIDRFGMRGFVGHHVWDWKAPDCPTTDAALESTLKLAKKYRNHPRVIAGIAPHAPNTTSPENLKKCGDLARAEKLTVMIHTAETRAEVDDMKKRYGKTPFEIVADSGLMDAPHCLLAHSVHSSPSDIELLKKYPNITTVLNPQCNAKLASGIPPFEAYKKNNIRFCLGTDGPASNNTLDIFSEMNFASKIHHVSANNLTGLPAQDILNSVTIRAAEALGISESAGSLELGKDADFIIIDFRAPHLTPMTSALNHIIHSVRGSDVHSTYVKGKALMKNRKILATNADHLMKKAESYFLKKIKPLIK